jgi:hypothetical protein
MAHLTEALTAAIAKGTAPSANVVKLKRRQQDR